MRPPLRALAPWIVCLLACGDRYGANDAPPPARTGGQDASVDAGTAPDATVDGGGAKRFCDREPRRELCADFDDGTFFPPWSNQQVRGAASIGFDPLNTSSPLSFQSITSAGAGWNSALLLHEMSSLAIPSVHVELDVHLCEQ